MIVTFDRERSASQLARDADAIPATSNARAVDRLNGAGVEVNRRKAGAFRQIVLGRPDRDNSTRNIDTRGLDGAVEKIMLDQILQIDLAESVPQIGAPQAWDSGYTGEGMTVAVLDTGIDSDHPDLAGQVVAAENFTDEPDATDTHGHGTHVASTIAGTGAASDGERTGVAPGADLLSGKVCNTNGQCQTSWIMAGMEWAVARGADVVNMSLGGSATDGTDPLSHLVNQLSAEAGSLFVTSAGNTRFGLRVVGSPGAADAALAVGAVDKNDRRAAFSSRGPRLGDHAVKPEITAPGVGIIAARGQGTSLGNPVDKAYTALDGTSMASPHVAGAAALLAQATGLTGGELKDALVSTAADGGLRWYEQGAGRVDVPAAMGSPVYAQGTVNIGGVDGAAQRDLIYTNRSDDEISLALRATAADIGGQPYAPITLSADTLTVPAHGVAAVTLTVAVDASELTGQEAFGGLVTAAGPGVSLRTVIGFGPPLQRVSIEVLDSNGDRVGSEAALDTWLDLIHDTMDRNIGGAQSYRINTSDGIAVGHVPRGTYTIIANVVENEPGSPSEITRITLLTKVEVHISGDLNLVLDARDAVPLEVSVPRRADKRNHSAALIRELAGSDDAEFTLTALGGGWPIYVTPTPPGEIAAIRLFVSWTLAEPQPLRPFPWEGSGGCRLPYRCYSETPAYVYNLPLLYENGIPETLHERVGRSELVEVPSHFHSDHTDALIRQGFETPTPFSLGAGFGDEVRIWFKPGKVTEYFLADDRITWLRRVRVERRPAGEPTQTAELFSDDRFPAAEAGARRGEENWWKAPLRMGMWDVREEALENPIAVERYATASRGGSDGNQFTIPFHLLDNNRGHGGSATSASWRMWNVDTGTELELRDRVFPLAPGTATYRLEQVEVPPPSRPVLTGPATTTWKFTSSPSDVRVPRPYECWIQEFPRHDVCQIQPLIRLEYDLGLDVHNRAPAGRAHGFTVVAGHHSKAVDRARVTSLWVQASFDDGETWQDGQVVGKPADTLDTGGLHPSAEPYQQFRVVLMTPPLHRTTGFVTLRVKAVDANGGSVDQTIHHAYTLK